MRQWIHENNNNNNATPTTIITARYHQIGCPWSCKPDVDRLLLEAKKADVIVFNIGAHYELGMMNHSIEDDHPGSVKTFSAFDFEFDLELYYTILHKFVQLEQKILLVRGPSPTHFDTADGIVNASQFKNWPGHYEYTCAPLQKVPTVVQRQEQVLRQLVHRLKQSNDTIVPTLNVDYLDVYSLTLDRYLEHANVTTKADDCKHFCQNCGILRAWNVLVADLIINTMPF